jgi:hypothetical protein
MENSMNTQTNKTKTPKPKLSERVASYTLAAQSASTKRSYAQDVRHFKTFAKIPATPDVVAEYLAKFAGVLSVATLQHRLIAIHQAHAEKGSTVPSRTGW